jgi:anti-sigma B factor antagonist
MKVHHEQHAGYVLVVVEGDVDVSNALDLRESLGSAITDKGTVLVDLSGVPFVDSSGIGILVAAHRLATQHGGRMLVVAPTADVRQVLAMTRTDRLLRIRDSVELASVELAFAEPGRE